MKLHCIIVDDEPAARKGIEEEIKEIGFLKIVGTAENAFQANELITKENPDLIILDIQMPKISGLELLKSLHHPPMAILITAYAEYALEGFNLDVIDYLVKPVRFERLLKACNKARDFFEMKKNTGSPTARHLEYFFIKADNKYEKILMKELLFVEAADNYVIIHTNEKSFITYLTLKNMEEYLQGDNFVKVHKSFIVALDKINSIELNQLTIGKKSIPVSRSLKDGLLSKIVGKNLIKR